MTAQAPGSNEASVQVSEQALSQFFPDKFCCLQRVFWEGKGERNDSQGLPNHPCNGVMHDQGLRSLWLNLAAPEGQCHETPGDQTLAVVNPPGEVVRRQSDGLALFIGRFTLAPLGFNGTIVLLDHIGTHTRVTPQLPPICAEPCNPRLHFEGWLEGEGEDSSGRMSLRAVIAGWLNGEQPDLIDHAVINGTIFRCQPTP